MAIFNSYVKLPEGNPYPYYGGFLKWGVPLNYPFIDGFSHEINHPAIGVAIGNPLFSQFQWDEILTHPSIALAQVMTERSHSQNIQNEPVFHWISYLRMLLIIYPGFLIYFNIQNI